MTLSSRSIYQATLFQQSSHQSYPDTPCTAYVPTLTPVQKMAYMEHLGTASLDFFPLIQCPNDTNLAVLPSFFQTAPEPTAGSTSQNLSKCCEPLQKTILGTILGTVTGNHNC